MPHIGWKCLKGAFVTVVALGFGFLILPLLVIIPLSFNVEPYFTFTEGMLRFDGDAYSLRWYRSIVENPEWRAAIGNSFFIGIFAAALATVLGTLAAMGLNHPKFPFREFVSAFVISPMVTPVIHRGGGSVLFLLRHRSRSDSPRAYPGSLPCSGALRSHYRIRHLGRV